MKVRCPECGAAAIKMEGKGNRFYCGSTPSYEFDAEVDTTDGKPRLKLTLQGLEEVIKYNVISGSEH